MGFLPIPTAACHYQIIHPVDNRPIEAILECRPSQPISIIGAWRPPLTFGMISIAVKIALTRKENANGQVYWVGRPLVKLHCSGHRSQRQENSAPGTGDQCLSFDQFHSYHPQESPTHSGGRYPFPVALRSTCSPCAGTCARCRSTESRTQERRTRRVWPCLFFKNLSFRIYPFNDLGFCL